MMKVVVQSALGPVRIGGAIQQGQAALSSEHLLRILAGKPYAGKLHVRIDEGEEEDKDRKCGSDPLPLAYFFSTLLTLHFISRCYSKCMLRNFLV